MGKSRAKTKAIKLGGRKQSDKKDKVAANKIFRRTSKVKLKTGEEENIPVSLKEVSDTWGFNSDGLAVYDPNLDEKYMRK